MIQKTKLGITLLAAAFALGLSAPAFAQDAGSPATATGPESRGGGLLGSSYTGVDFTYDHVSSTSPSEWRGFGVDLNHPLSAGLDLNLAYNWARANNYLVRLTQQAVLGGVTAYSPLEWGKPYVQALAGWGWRDGYVGRDHSFAYLVGTGVEFQVAPAWVVTPYVNFTRSTSFNKSETDFGVKTAYRITREWSLTAGVQYEAVRHAKDGTGYTFGVNYHY